MHSPSVIDRKGIAVGRGGHEAPMHCPHAGVARVKRTYDDDGMATRWRCGEWEEEVGDVGSAGSPLGRGV